MITYVFPGQGSQSKGMGGALFDEFKELTAQADQILGYSIKDLCMEDPNSNLGLTQYTQPALYIVNALSYLKRIKDNGKKPDFVAGHSLGEYDALFAGGAFDFATGLKLVKKRGELMSRATGGGMAAVIGLNEEQIADVLKQHNLQSIDIANLNSPYQIVLSGPKNNIDQVKAIFEGIKDVKMFAPLKTSGAFHSRYMKESGKEFESFINTLKFSELTVPVISNVHARPYRQSDIKQNLIDQITHPVKWTESIRYLMGRGEMEFEELGPGKVLTGLIQRIKKEAEPLVVQDEDTKETGKTEGQTEPGKNIKGAKPAVNHDNLPEKVDSNENSGSALGKTVSGMIKNVQEKTKELVSSTEDTITKVASAAKTAGATVVAGTTKAASAAKVATAAGASKAVNAAKAAVSDKKEHPQEEKMKQTQKSSSKILLSSLGNPEFKKDYNLKYAYLAGGMYKGVASPEMVVKMGKAGMMGFYGSGGVDLAKVEEVILYIQKKLSNGEAYGINLIHNENEPAMEEKTVDLLLRYGVKNIEAAAFLSITSALVKYRAKGLTRDKSGKVIASNKIIAKISRPEVAEVFLSPAPEHIVTKLLTENKISQDEAALLKEMPVADDITAEADSGGHTDGAVAYALLPAIIKLRDEMMEKYHYDKKVRVGAAGGIGTPGAVAAALIMGADYILTGSINQCTVEAATSDPVKDLLQQMNVQDTEYAPAGDMFELGAKVQVLKKGLFFPARANKLYDLYRQYNSINEIDEKTKSQLQEKYFKRSFEKIFDDCKAFYPAQEIEKAERNPKHKMALIFRWYFGYSTRIALNGDTESKVDYQVNCGPALGAFNQWVKGTPLEDWRNRHVDEIAVKLMEETATLLNERYQSFLG